MDTIMKVYNIPVIENVDVLVVGGGPAGIAAAIASARMGSKTLLAEVNGYLGGAATASLVGPFMTSYSPDSTRQIVKGVFEEIVLRMEKEGGAIHPEHISAGTSYSSYINRGHEHITPFNSECLKVTAEQMCIEAGVKLQYHMLFLDAIIEDKTNAVKGGIFATKAGLVAVSSNITIDCTGDGDVANKAGVHMKLGRDGDGLTQPSTLFFRIRNVNKTKVEKYRSNHPEPDTMQFATLVEVARKNGDFPIQREKLGVYESVPQGEWRVNTTRMTNVNATDPKEVTKAEITGRQQVRTVLNFMKNYVPGFENVELVETAHQLGVRESRRIVGEYVLTEEDLLESRIFSDAIALGGFAIDIHQPDGKSGDFILIKSGKPYSIPYRCLVPSTVSNLLVAGRCISASHIALGAVRVMPICFATGQAAGVAAAIASNEKIGLKEMNIDKLKLALQKQGAIIE